MKKSSQLAIDIICVLFYIAPVLFFIFLNLASTRQSQTILDLLKSSPELTLRLTSYSLLPFVGYILHVSKKKKATPALYITTLLLMIAAYLLDNIYYGMLLLFLMIFLTVREKVGLTAVFKAYSNVLEFLKHNAGEITVVMIAIVVKVLLLRI